MSEGPYREKELADQRAEAATGPLAWMARNGVAANVLMIVLISGGITMLGRIKQEVFPEIEVDTILVQVAYPGASPSEVEQGICLSVEEAVRGLDGIEEVRCTANESVATVGADLILGTNPDRALSDVKSAVDRIASFPENAERPVISIATNRAKVISLVLSGDVSEEELWRLAEDSRRSLLESDRITYVEISGVRPLEISVEIPQSRLREYGLTMQQVAASIRAASIDLPGGSVKTSGGEILLRTTERRDRGEEFGDIVLLSGRDGAQVRLRDIADVRDAFQETDQEAFFNGERAAMVNVYRVGDQTPITVANAVKEWITDNGEMLPSGITATTWNDSSEMYQQRISLLERNAYIGLVLVFIILGFFLEPKLAVWVTLGIPISFAGSLIFLPAADISINMISLFAFIVTLGMVVDDAIIVGEAIYYRRESAGSMMAAAVEGAKEVGRPVTFSILTTCIAFAPLLFVPGVMGKFFRVIPAIVISVLLISLIESLFVLPAHLAHEMPWWLRLLLWPLLKVMNLMQAEKVGKGLEWFVLNVYEPFLVKALRWRYLTFAACLAILIGTVGLVAGGRVGFTFLPKIESDLIQVSLRMPVGTPVDETRAIAARIVSTADELIDEINNGGDYDIKRGIFNEVGSATVGGGPGGLRTGNGSHLSSAALYLVQSDLRPITTGEFVEQWREKIGEIPGAEALTFSFSIGGGAGKPIDVELSHPDSDILETASERLAAELRSYGGLRDVDSGVSLGKEQFDLTLRPEARAQGLTERDLATQVRSAFYGIEAARQQRGRQELRVYVRSPEEERRSVNNIENLIVRTPAGGEMPLGQAAIIDRGRAYTSIKRTEAKRVINVTADVDEDSANAAEIAADLTKGALPALQRDFPGLTFRFAGEQKERAKSMAALGRGFIVAMLIMIGLLSIAFRSYIQWAIIMIAIPFGIVGAIWGHAAMGFSLSFMSMMGIVALSGVVVNDSLILVVAVNEFRESGMRVWDAVKSGGVRRFRPILLTSLTTFFGLTPMILEPSVQARFLVPMAISLGFGVLFATFIMLVLVPSTYLIIEDVKYQAGKFVAILRDKARPTPTHYEDFVPRPEPAE